MSYNSNTEFSHLDDVIVASVRQLELFAGFYEKRGKQPQAEEIRKLVSKIKQQIDSSAHRS